MKSFFNLDKSDAYIDKKVAQLTAFYNKHKPAVKNFFEETSAKVKETGTRFGAHVKRHKHKYIDGTALTVLAVGAYFTMRQTEPKVEEFDATVTGHRTEMQVDPITQKPFKAFIIETSEGDIEGDAFWKQSSAMSRQDAASRQNTLRSGIKYHFVTVSAPGMEQPAIMDVMSKQPDAPKP